MANHLFNYYDGSFSSHPWPTRSWSYNSHALSAMKICIYMDKIMKKNPLQWGKDEDQFFESILESSEEFYKNYGRDSIKVQPSNNNK